MGGGGITYKRPVLVSKRITSIQPAPHHCNRKHLLRSQPDAGTLNGSPVTPYTHTQTADISPPATHSC